MVTLIFKILALISVILITYGSKNNKSSVKYAGFIAALLVAISLLFL